jgi:hypothetical protein
MDELADAVHGLRLAALEVADEVPAKSVAVERVFRLEVLRSVLADHLHPSLCQDTQFLRRHVLRRRDDRDARTDLGADAVVALPDLLR